MVPPGSSGAYDVRGQRGPGEDGDREPFGGLRRQRSPSSRRRDGAGPAADWAGELPVAAVRRLANTRRGR